MSERYPNKRILLRQGGRFRKATMEAVGIGGVCPTCRHLLIRGYDGPPNDTNPDPRRFRNRCYNCEPEVKRE